MENRLPNRKSLRLKTYDYSQCGAYFITICLNPRLPLLGQLVGISPETAHIELSTFGKIIMDTWSDLTNHTHGFIPGPFIVMPDHIHAIVILEERAGLGPAPTPLPEIIRQLKSFSARRVNQARGMPGATLWQRGYYEHVIRNQQDFDEAADYILKNPARWFERLQASPNTLS